MTLSISSWFRSDGRYFQIVSQLAFLTYGVLALGWDHDYLNYMMAFIGAVGTQLIFISAGKAPWNSIRSAFITTLGLSLLLKTNAPAWFLFAGFAAIAQKFAFRINGKHLWNPAAFGIVLTILISHEAWVSPGQWGSAAVLVFAIGTAGLAVLSRVKRLETGIVFILSLAILEYCRTVLYLGWEHDVFLHKMSSGAIWLFAFFMITDPMTIPLHRIARIVWAMVIALIAFWLANFHFVNASPIWVLVLATPLSPLINKLFAGPSFRWIRERRPAETPDLIHPVHSTRLTLKSTFIMKQLRSFLTGLAIVLVTSPALAFCGFYVAKADATLFNNKSEIILVRDGLRTVITMSNDFKGDVRDFAMVVPVPVVLREQDIRVVNRRVFDALDAYSAPRLTEYYDPEPCMRRYYDMKDIEISSMTRTANAAPVANWVEEERLGVTIEAKYTIGEYDILILSAKESGGLRDWLTENGYKIPPAADEVLKPYILSNTKFFVVKVNLDRLRASGFDYLNPIQIEFEHEKFMLPIRLGMANSAGFQDMIVYAFTRSGRIECTNYRTVKVPTDRNIPLFVKPGFGEFYKSVFEKAWTREGKNAIFLEYAWNVSPQQIGAKCDPCVGPPPIYDDFTAAGVWWAGRNNPDNVFFTRLHVRYAREQFPADLQFQITPNSEHFQARYVLNNPAGGPFDCEEGQAYLSRLRDRRSLEADELYALTGKRDSRAASYINEFEKSVIKRSEVPEKKTEIVSDKAPKKQSSNKNPPSEQPTKTDDKGIQASRQNEHLTLEGKTQQPNERSVYHFAIRPVLSVAMISVSILLLILSAALRRKNGEKPG